MRVEIDLQTFKCDTEQIRAFKFDLIMFGGFMFLHSLISIDEVLSESDFVRLLETFGVEVINSSLKSFSFDNYGSSNLQIGVHTYVTSNKYTLRYLGEDFALSYSTVEESGTGKEGLSLLNTYICVLTTDISLDLLQKLAHYFDTFIEIVDRAVSNRFIRNLPPF